MHNLDKTPTRQAVSQVNLQRCIELSLGRAGHATLVISTDIMKEGSVSPASLSPPRFQSGEFTIFTLSIDHDQIKIHSDRKKGAGSHVIILEPPGVFCHLDEKGNSTLEPQSFRPPLLH